MFDLKSVLLCIAAWGIFFGVVGIQMEFMKLNNFLKQSQVNYCQDVKMYENR